MNHPFLRGRSGVRSTVDALHSRSRSHVRTVRAAAFVLPVARQRRGLRLVAALIAAAMLAALLTAGCTGPSEASADVPGAFLASYDGSLATPFVDDAGNDFFDTASKLSVTPDASRSIRADIDAGDVDVYEIQDVFAGDRIIIEVKPEVGFDPATAIFDADLNLMYANDDRDFFGGGVDARVDFIARRDSPRCYIAVAASPSTRSTGQYVLTVTLRPDAPVPQPNRQVVLLNFDGAKNVRFAGRRPVDIPIFDAGTISPTLAGRTDELMDLIIQRVRGDFDGLDVVIRSSRDDPPVLGTFSTLHFGAYDRALLGVAENVDEFNERRQQEAIVFTDTFEIFDVIQPSIEQYAQALANVASHEIGHLLGLVHTADAKSVMDITASLRQLTRDQAFSFSPLDDTVFPIGFQNAPVTLVDSVGGDLNRVIAVAEAQRRTAQAKIALDPLDSKAAELDPLPARAVGALSLCLCHRCEVSRMKRRHAAH